MLNEQEKEMNDMIAQVSGLPVFTTDLYLPRYKDGIFGRWKISHALNTIAPGYSGNPYLTTHLPVLSRKSDKHPDVWETWMSLAPYELESQELGCRYAYGHTVIMGLGMGWIAVNAALSPHVTKVTIIELDKEVIELFQCSGVMDDLSEEVKEKITIVNANSLEWKSEEKVDFLYADIWLYLDEPQTLSDVRQMQKNLNAEMIYFWGQEITLYAESLKLINDEEALTPEIVRKCTDKEIKLPLLLPEHMDYAEFISKVMNYRKGRNLSLGNHS